MQRDAPQSQVQSSVRACPPSTKELFLTIPMHTINRALFPGKKKRVQQCPLKSVTVADTFSSSVKVVSRSGVAEAERCGWPLAGAAHSTSQG